MNKYSTPEMKSELINKLQNSTVEIEFKKLNGETRNMKCTLREGIIPKASKSDTLSQTKVRKVSPEVLVVWDVNKNDWRSMRWDNIVEVTNEQQSETTNMGSTS